MANSNLWMISEDSFDPRTDHTYGSSLGSARSFHSNLECWRKQKPGPEANPASSMPAHPCRRARRIKSEQAPKRSYTP